ncbi:MAG: hypothetical protein WBV77_06340 [Solirubrobacteraceae bacterium]
MSSVVGLGVSSLLDVDETVALLGRGVESARELGGENVVWVAPWSGVVTSSALVPGV